MSGYLAEQGTYRLLQILPFALGTQRRPVVQGFGAIPHRACMGCILGIGCSGRCYVRFGADSPSWSDQVLQLADRGAARVSSALSTAASLPGNMAHQAAAWTRGELLAAQADFIKAAQASKNAGLDAASSIIDTLSKRTQDALAALGKGAGDAFRGFWGLSPAGFIGGAAVLGAAVILALGLSGGGQAYLGSVGAGFGRGIGEVGAGYGGAAREVGRSLPALLKVL